ncbi:MAG: glutathione S-transferase N-terminal domain-containing protein [Byssovorax sp.]
MATLIALHYSPWTEKARWALDHHRVPYRLEHYVPMLGEPLLRLRTGRFTGPATVPVLLDGDGAIFDSFSIARHAERNGSGAPLFPAAHLAEITRWNDRADQAMAQGRAIVVARIAASRGAQAEALPGFIPEAIRPALTGMAQLVTRYLAFKYSASRDLEGAEARVAGYLDELRAALDGRAYLLDGELTYADIAAALALQGVRPVRDAFIRLGPATRTCWTMPALAGRYADLLEWRDQLYEKHRRG